MVRKASLPPSVMARNKAKMMKLLFLTRADIVYLRGARGIVEDGDTGLDGYSRMNMSIIIPATVLQIALK